MKRLLLCFGLIVVILSTIISCTNMPTKNAESPVSMEIPESVSFADTHETDAHEEPDEAEKIRLVCEKVNSIDFSVKEFPINTEINNSETDKVYKAAFLKAINNEVQLKQLYYGEMTYYRELLRGVVNKSEDEFFEYIRKGGYNYLDFDGDGLPELVIQVDGPTVLKYILEEDQVYVYAGYSEYCHLLGANQIYYYNPTSANRRCYGYISLGENGIVDQDVWFDIYYDHNEEGWYPARHYVILSGEMFGIDVGKEKWDEITKGFFEAIENAIPPVSFDEVFVGVS